MLAGLLVAGEGGVPGGPACICVFSLCITKNTIYM